MQDTRKHFLSNDVRVMLLVVKCCECDIKINKVFQTLYDKYTLKKFHKLILKIFFLLIQKRFAHLYNVTCKLPSTQLLRGFQNTHSSIYFDDNTLACLNVSKKLSLTLKYSLMCKLHILMCNFLTHIFVKYNYIHPFVQYANYIYFCTRSLNL